MDKRIGFIFRVIYLFIALFSWFVAYEIYKVDGIYQGKLPESISKEMNQYVYNQLIGLLNLATVWGLCGGTTICAAVGMMRFVLEKPLLFNLQLMSIMFNITWGLLHVLEWANVIGGE